MNAHAHAHAHALAAEPTENRRRMPRVPFQRPARITRSARTWPVRVLDLSVNGAFVALPRQCRALPGERLRLEIDVADQTVAVEVIVVRVRGKRVGVRCVAMRPEAALAIRALVCQELGSAELADRGAAALR